MRVLAVFSHPQRDSLTGRVLDRFVAGLAEAGHEPEIADLHGEGFDPVFRLDDFAQFHGSAMPGDVLAEQARFDRCDAFALVFPVWWWSFPAMLKGWLDRVFSAGWAYHAEPDPTRSLLRERRAVVLCCAGSSARQYRDCGYDRSFHNIIESGILSYCGVSDAAVHVLFESNRSEEVRAGHLDTAYRIGRDFIAG